MSNKKNSFTLFSRVVLWGNISSQSETGLYYLQPCRGSHRDVYQHLCWGIAHNKTYIFDTSLNNISKGMHGCIHPFCLVSIKSHMVRMIIIYQLNWYCLNMLSPQPLLFGGRLCQFLVGWKRITNDPYVLSIVTKGYRLRPRWNSDIAQKFVTNIDLHRL